MTKRAESNFDEVARGYCHHTLSSLRSQTPEDRAILAEIMWLGWVTAVIEMQGPRAVADFLRRQAEHIEHDLNAG